MTKLNNLINESKFDSNYTSKLDKNNYANFFDVVNKGELSYFNICKNLYIDNAILVNKDLISYYQIEQGDTWTAISYKFFKTYKLWWIICKFNNVLDPFKQLVEGRVLIIPSQQIVDSVITVISNN